MDLRDTLSRSQLKLPDLGGVGELLLGDRLIRANRGLAVVLDGVYRRGEVYLRWLQRLSSLAFGTAVGRFLCIAADGTRRHRSAGVLVALELAQNLMKILGFAKIPVNRGKADIGDIIERLQRFHDEPANLTGGNLGFA